jgi:diguanylate cyclase (GGDEF)-like protein
MNQSDLPSISTRRRHKVIYLIIYFVIIAAILLLTVYTSRLDFLTTENAIQIEPTAFDQDFNTYELSHDDEHIFHYTVDLAKADFSQLDGEHFKLVINSVHSNAITVHFNDQLIISEGDMSEGLSMLRAGFVHGTIEKGLIEDQNTLAITTYASYRTGTFHPVVISENTPGNRNIGALRLFNDRLVTLGIGLVIMSGLFSLFIYFLNRKDNAFLLWLSLATLFTGGYLWDYLTMPYLLTDYLVIKKFFLLNLSLGILFYGLASYSLLKKKYVLTLPVMQLIYYLIIFFTATNMIDFRYYYNYFFFSIIAVVLFLLIVTFKQYKQNNTIFVMLLHYSTIFTLGLLSLIKGFKLSYYSLSTPIFIIFVIGFLPLIITYVLFLEKDIKLLKERDLKQQAVTQSITDGLTGAYNNYYLQKQLKKLNDTSVLAIVDLDNLKPLNDTYGHLAGDYVLRYLTNTIKQYIRKTDVLYRYGGDEFVIIFKDCALADAKKIMTDVRLHIHDDTLSFNNDTFTTSISVGMCDTSKHTTPENILQCADQALYQAKRQGKNQLFFRKLNG